MTTYQEVHIRQQVEDILQLVDDLVVDGKFACCHSLQVRADVQQLWIQSLQTVNLVCDALWQSSHCGILDISVHTETNSIVISKKVSCINVCVSAWAVIRRIRFYRSRCSTPTSSASSAPISLVTCSNVLDVGVPSLKWQLPSVRQRHKRSSQCSVLQANRWNRIMTQQYIMSPFLEFKQASPKRQKSLYLTLINCITLLFDCNLTHIVYFLYGDVGFCGQTKIFGLHIYDD